MPHSPQKHAPHLKTLLRNGACSIEEIETVLGIRRQALSDVVLSLEGEVIQFCTKWAAHCALIDHGRNSLRTLVSSVNAEGQVHRVGMLEPVYPDGFVLKAKNGTDSYSEGLPWWLYDLCPQGYLGRIYAALNAELLALPECIKDWSDKHVLRALQEHGDDLPGNLLIGVKAENRFIRSQISRPIAIANKFELYTCMASSAEASSLQCSRVGGDQPKFTAQVEAEHGIAHVIVKFSAKDDDFASERWRDLLLAEHIALKTLEQSGITAAKSQIIDYAGRRFLEVERFDRLGATGRVGLYSLAALDAEFVGTNKQWHIVTRVLEEQQCVEANSVAKAQLLWAFGTLIGNDDMHNGNLSFTSEFGQTCHLAPAYDMSPMSFAPNRGAHSQGDFKIHALSIEASVWRDALHIAKAYTSKLHGDRRLSNHFAACLRSTISRIANVEAQL